ncbi:MAG: hypothetical protein V3S21_04135, partial [Xanthomonadales bacterium]
EYKRDVLQYARGDLAEPPPFPECYFSAKATRIAERFVEQAKQAVSADQPVPGLLEEELVPELDNTWGDTAKAIINNWLGLVYQLTNLDRKQQFMAGVDPDDPLALNR